MPAAIELAAALQEMSDDALDALVLSRGVPQHAATYFDVAEHLLARDQIAAALETATSDEVHSAARGVSSERMDRLGLGVAGRPFPEVQRQAAAANIAEPSVPATARQPDLPAAAERAFASVALIGEVIAAMHVRPAQLLLKGGITANDGRRLAETFGATPDTIDDAIDVARGAALITSSNQQLFATPAADAWLAAPFTTRWESLVAGWLDSLTEPERELAAAIPADVPLRAALPLAGDRVQARAERVRNLATWLGLQDGSPTGFHREGGAALLADLVPGEVRHAYVQPDLSIVAPGPLTASLEARLRELADLEQRGTAATYRLSSASISRALALGASRERILEFLDELSLTGVPQPVAYLVRDAAERFGALKVAARAPRGAIVTSDDDALLARLSVDRSLAPFALRRIDEHRLATAIEPERLLDALLEQRYPATLVDAHGAAIPSPRHVMQRETRVASPLVQRLRGAGFDVGAQERAWLERRLQTAARDRITVQVRVTIGDEERELALLPLGVAHGRLRARDATSDVERTLPLDAITHLAGVA